MRCCPRVQPPGPALLHEQHPCAARVVRMLRCTPDPPCSSRTAGPGGRAAPGAACSSYRFRAIVSQCPRDVAAKPSSPLAADRQAKPIIASMFCSGLSSPHGGALFDPGEQHAVGLVQDVGPHTAVRLRVHSGQGCQSQVGVRLEPLLGRAEVQHRAARHRAAVGVGGGAGRNPAKLRARDEAGYAISGSDVKVEMPVVLFVAERGQDLAPPCCSTTCRAADWTTSSS